VAGPPARPPAARRQGGIALRSPAFGPQLRRRLTADLEALEPQRLRRDGARRAAVVLALVPGDDERACVVLTRRAPGLSRHSGQFALPGGRLDAGETLVEAGLRELREEIGLGLDERAVLGRLDDFATRSGFVITPLVAWGGPAELVPAPEEVAEIYRVPIAECAELVPVGSQGRDSILALALPTVGTWVVPPAAAILHQLAELILHRRHTPVADLPQPVFAWR